MTSRKERVADARRRTLNQFGEPFKKKKRVINGLEQLLSALARLLVPAGITPKYFEQLATRAFVHAAGDIARCRNGRINRSRVAALTSLRRGEIRRILSERSVSRLTELNQPEKVISGWLSDKRFTDSSGRPRRLRIRGSRNSFMALTREFAGDIPYRAVLEELRRSKVVRERGNLLELIPSSHAQKQPALIALEAILPVLIDGLVVAQNETPPNCAPKGIQRASLKASDVLELQLLRERAIDSAAAFVDGLKRSSGAITHRTRSVRAMKQELTVTVIIGEHLKRREGDRE